MSALHTFFDAHCHLQDERYDGGREEVLGRARSAGVCRMMCCGSSESDWPAVRQLAAQTPALLPSFGVHPWYVKERSEGWFDTLERLLGETAACVGEIGLDHAIEPRNDAEQDEVFVRQVRLANALRRPVSIHCRKAWGRLQAILESEGGLVAGGVIHSYSGAPDFVRILEGLGLYVSFSGTITRSGNTKGRRAAELVSSDRLLIETDSPDLPPVGWDRVVNEPAAIVRIAQSVADIRAVPVDALAAQTCENACRLFRVVSA